MSKFTVFMADSEKMREMVRGIHEWMVELLIEAGDAVDLGKFRTALDRYYTLYTVLRDCILPWLDSYVSCGLRCEGEKEKKYVE